MNLDRKLNLVIPVECANGSTVHVHATPISRATFDQFFMVMAKASAAIFANNLGHIMGPRIAAKMLRKVATDFGPGQLEVLDAGLMAEMKRLTNVLVLGETGWVPMPIDQAIARKVIDEDDADEVENIVAFFILVSATLRKRDGRELLEAATPIWGAQLTSFSSTTLGASLATSTPAVATGERATLSSIPS